jgi:hypothetical protein
MSFMSVRERESKINGEKLVYVVTQINRLISYLIGQDVVLPDE